MSDDTGTGSDGARSNAPASEATPTTDSRSSRVNLRDFLARYGLLVVFGAVVLIFKGLRPENFLTQSHVQDVLFLSSSFVPLLLLATALTFVLAMGDFDLSFGSMVGLAGATAVALMVNFEQPVWVAILAALGVGAAVGVFNGYVISYLGASSFVITLAGYIGLKGIEQLWTSNRSINIPVGDQPFFVDLARNKEFWNLGRPVYIAFAIVAVAWIVMDRTEIGRYMYAIGGNPEAARLAGIPVARIRAQGFVIVALLASLVGLLLTAGNSGIRLNLGDAFLLDAYAAVFVGAAVFRPGQFSIPGTIVGALFLRVIETGLLLLQISNAWVNIAKGVILVFGVLVSQTMLRRK
ncbi:MAG: ABC transporter permease [bacterium]|nr:ABC transporter permease [bacterium]